MNKHRLNMGKDNPKKNNNSESNLINGNVITPTVTNPQPILNGDDELFKLFDFLQEESRNKRLLAEKSNDPNYYYGMVSAYLDIQSKILKTINKK